MGSPQPGDLLRPAHLLGELLFTGYYSAAVWVAYLLAGMALGRLPLARRATATRVLVVFVPVRGPLESLVAMTSQRVARLLVPPTRPRGAT